MNIEEIKSCVDYDRHTGAFTYKSGKKANKINNQGYIRVSINGNRYLAHRIAYLICHGEIPEGMQIDHINRIRTDNRAENLRLVTHLENRRNRVIQSNNTSGINGVSVDKRSGRLEVHIKLRGKKIYLGTYETEAEAKAARYAANRILNFTDKHGTEL